MNWRGLLGSFLVIVCLAILWGVSGQRSQLAGLRAEQQRLLAQLAMRADDSTSAGTAEAGGAGSGTPRQTLLVTPDLLRLRNEVTRLTQRRRELASERAENERLRAQVASRGTNGPGGFQLPPGYVRKSEARMMGYNTPDDTLQTLLWATRNHDWTNVLQAFAPERAKELRGEFGESGQSIERVLDNAAGFFGMRIVERKPGGKDGSSIVAEVEVVPGVPGPTVGFRQINGQWKIEWGL